MKPNNYIDLLAAYRTIWNNRLLEANQENAEEILKDAIIRELLDENSHPRIRKNKYEKFFMATRKITHSSLLHTDQLQLISLHIELFEKLID